MDPQRHSVHRNIIESILRHVPGFRGYLDKEYRRESDFLARTWLANRLQGAKQPIDGYFRTLLDSGQLDAMSQLDRIRTRLESVILKIRSDVRGYSGFFDFVRIDESVLDRIYDQDMSLVQDADKFAKSCEALGIRSDTPQQVTTSLLQQLDVIATRFRQRSEILKGIDDA